MISNSIVYTSGKEHINGGARLRKRTVAVDMTINVKEEEDSLIQFSL
jgi:hypothetical protein